MFTVVHITDEVFSFCLRSFRLLASDPSLVYCSNHPQVFQIL